MYSLFVVNAQQLGWSLQHGGGSQRWAACLDRGMPCGAHVQQPACVADEQRGEQGNLGRVPVAAGGEGRTMTIAMLSAIAGRWRCRPPRSPQLLPEPRMPSGSTSGPRQQAPPVLLLREKREDVLQHLDWQVRDGRGHLSGSGSSFFGLHPAAVGECLVWDECLHLS